MRLLLPRFVLERDAKLRSIRNLAALREMDVLGHNLGDPKVANRRARRPDCNGRGVFPGLGASSDQVCNSVDAHAILLAVEGVSPWGQVIPDDRFRDKAQASKYNRPARATQARPG